MSVCDANGIFCIMNNEESGKYMAITYCTSCGEEPFQKICEHCDAKQDKVHHFCKYCGITLMENAFVCV